MSKYRYFISFVAKVFGKRFGDFRLFRGIVYQLPNKQKEKEMKRYLKQIKF